MVRVVLYFVVLFSVVVTAAYGFRKPLTLWLVEKTLDRNLGSNLLQELPDGLHLLMCGAGSPMVDAKRSGPCAAIVAGEHLFIVDAGSGASRVLNRLRLPQGDIDAVLLTHYHSDHIDGLGELMLQRWVTGSHPNPLPIIGPKGLAAVVQGFNTAYSQDSVYRIDHHGEAVVPANGPGGEAREFSLDGEGKTRLVFNENGLKIHAMSVSHEPVEAAVAYRFDYKGRSIVISGDTAEDKALIGFAKDVDLLVHEALDIELVAVLESGAKKNGRDNIAKISRDIMDYHTTPEQAASIAEAAGAEYLLFNHIVPPLPIKPMEEIFVEGVDERYSGTFAVGEDGMLIELLANDKSISVDYLF